MRKKTKVKWGIVVGILFIGFAVMHPNLFPSTETIKVIAFCTGVSFLTMSFIQIDTDK